MTNTIERWSAIFRDLGDAARPQLIVASEDSWNDFVDRLTPEIKDGYVRDGYYKVTRINLGLHRELTAHIYIDALQFKGIPVVRRSDYEWLMAADTKEYRRVLFP